ncbi:MAG: hypothetical protein LBJ00_12345 [Planctomycetaceae bacterium]|nr:hypothetical protein [Planctomycetaceae bacterium]
MVFRNSLECIFVGCVGAGILLVVFFCYNVSLVFWGQVGYEEFLPIGLCSEAILKLLLLYSSCFKIPEVAVDLQRRALGKRNNVKRLFKGKAS